MEPIIYFNGKAYSRTGLLDMSISKLLTLYNQIAAGVGELKSFKDKPTAMSRTWLALEALETNTRQEALGAKEKTVTETAAKKTREKHFNFPFAGPIKPSRGDTLRTRTVELLRTGATFEQIVAAVVKFDEDRKATPKNVERRAYEIIRIVHYFLGYGLRQDESGKIFLVEA